MINVIRFPFYQVLNEDKEQNIIAEEPNIEEDEFGFNSNDTIFCSVPEVSVCN